VLYGGKKDPVSIQLELRELERLLHSRSGEQAVVQLDMTDEPDLSCPALLKNVQHHPIRGDILHADFVRIRLDERITTLVPIELSGRARGVAEEGGVLDHQLRELEVECLALEVPELIAVDVTELSIGDSLHVSDIVVPANVTVVTEDDRAIVAVHAPRVIQAEEEEEAEAEAAEEGEGAPEEGAAEGAASEEGGESTQSRPARRE